MMAEQPSLRYFQLNVNYKECHNSIVGVLLLSQSTITLLKQYTHTGSDKCKVVIFFVNVLPPPDNALQSLFIYKC